jgi:molybdopterin molybdotransferase
MERISPEEARELVLHKVFPKKEIENILLLGAVGRICAEDIKAPLDSPPYDRSAMDGYALRSADTKAASAATPVRLKLVGVFYAGDAPRIKLESGEAVRIMTGAMFPPGCDCVVMQENVKTEKAGDECFALISSPVAFHENYISAGEDIKKGQLLVNEGQCLDFARLGILASMGFESVPVYQLPVIGLLCTGDELSPAGKPLPPGKIYNSNETLLAARLLELGFKPKILPSACDSAGDTAAEIDSVIEGLDVLITTGAVSVGEKDIFHEVFKILGAEKLFWRLASKPGGAVLCGIYRGKPLLCLSGNPFAALTGFELIVRPALAKIASRPDLDLQRQIIRLGEGIGAKPIRRFMRSRVENGEAHLPDAHLSGQLFSLAGCNCLLDIAPDISFNPGDELSALLF